MENGPCNSYFRAGSGAAWVFLSDHGEKFGEHGGRNHDTLYEEVMRVPLLVKAPGLEPETREEVVQLIDLLPALLKLLGVGPLRGLEGSRPGIDLFNPAPAATGPAPTPRLD